MKGNRKRRRVDRFEELDERKGEIIGEAFVRYVEDVGFEFELE